MQKTVIHSDQAPAAIGTYSQAIKVDETVYLSGQIPLVADTMQLVGDDIRDQVRQVFDNLNAVATAAGLGAVIAIPVVVGFLLVDFCSMEITGLKPLISSTSGRSILPIN